MREAFLSLTPTGRAIYEELAPIALDFAKHVTDAIAPADRAAFERAVERLTKKAATLAPPAERRKRHSDVARNSREENLKLEES